MCPASPLQYRVRPERPEAHLFSVELSIPASPESAQTPLTLSMPAWIPGSYMIRDFARNIVSLSAFDADGPVALEQLDKQTWRLAASTGPVKVCYQVYAWDLSVRSAHLDITHAYFNGPSLFLRVSGFDDGPCRLELLPPEGEDYARWRVATSLVRVDAEPWGFGTYVADDYADLIDHPVEMGHFEVIGFQVGEVPHWMAITGRQRADLARLERDLERICRQHAGLFGELPIDRYLFQTTLVGSGFGGLEHRFSTSLLYSRSDLAKPGDGPISAGYRRFLGLCSHEYFHLWNVKRIRPAAFADNGLDREVHTRTLWAFEGITSYYDDLALVRSGCIDARGYLEMLAETITRVMRTPGRLRQTLASSSFDAWTKFYKQDENAPNAIVSYYGKGALTALALDLIIRRDTRGARSLDDVMRALWQRYGRTGIGVPERGVEAVATEISGLDLDGFFAQALDSTTDLDLEGLLASAGVMMRLRPQKDAKDNGGVAERFEPIVARPDIGIRLQPDTGEAQIAVVLDGRPAQRAGLSAGDTLITIDGLRVNAGNLDDLLGWLPAGAQVEIHAFRRDELMRFQVRPEPAPSDTCELCLLSDPPGPALQRRTEWLGRAA